MALADLNIVSATSATSFEYKHNCIKFRETNMHCFFYFFAVTKPQKFERQSQHAMSSPLQATLADLFCKIQLLQKSDKRHLQGAFI